MQSVQFLLAGKEPKIDTNMIWFICDERYQIDSDIGLSLISEPVISD